MSIMNEIHFIDPFEKPIRYVFQIFDTPLSVSGNLKCIESVSSRGLLENGKSSSLWGKRVVFDLW